MVIKVLSPAGVLPASKCQVSSRIGDLNGKVICIVDNGKPNFDVYVKRVEELLRQKYNLAQVIHVKKGHLGSSNPTPQDRLDELARTCHAVISGIGD
ncbi:MAG TPA: hypothetical protein VMT62_18350 [Syntrophorhabdaceae bacterium]|nr:hypothetical protein [Syntrophorhabdaceae bacterium]